MRPIHLGITVLLLAAVVASLWIALSDGAGIAFAGASGKGKTAGAKAAILGSGSGDGGEDDEGSSNARVALAPAALPSVEVPAAAKKSWSRPRLSGRVVDPSGAAIAGARVFAATGSSWLAIPLDLEPEGLPRSWIRVERATTDADGEFVLAELRPGDLRLAVRAAGFAPRYADRLELAEAAESRLADLHMEPGVVLEGRVVDADGKGVGGAALLVALDATSPAAGGGITLPGHGIPLAESSPDGSFHIDELAPGPWRILVDAAGAAIFEEEGRTEHAGERVAGLVFRLERGFEILGRVRAEDGSAAPAGLRVAARPSPEREANPVTAADDRIPDATDSRSRVAITEADGAFVLRGVRADVRYLLTVSEKGEDAGEWRRARGAEPVQAWAGQRGVEVVYRPPAALVFRVLDGGTGAPLSTFTVRAGVGEEGDSPVDARGETLRTFPEGRGRTGDLRPRRGSPGFVLRVSAAGYKDFVRKDIAIAPGQELDLGDLRLDPEHVVTARVVDGASGAPVEGARVLLGEVSDEEILARLSSTPDTDFWTDSEVRFARTDAAGVARLSSLPGATITARADARGCLPSDPFRTRLPDEGDLSIELRVKRGGIVDVRVVDADGRPVEGVAIQHKRPGSEEEGGEEVERKTDASGLVRFEPLPPGVHAFRVGEGRSPFEEEESEAASTGWVEAVASEGSRTTLEFKAPSRGGLRGVVSEGGRPLASARLHLEEVREEGDVDPGWFAPGATDPYTTNADHDGTYRFDGLRCGRYKLFVSHAGRKMPAVFEVEIANPPERFDVALDVASIEGRVTGADGAPAAGVQVLATSVSGDEGTAQSFRMILLEDDRGAPRIDYRPEGKLGTTTDPNGRYVLRGVRSGEPLRVSASGDFVLPSAIEGVLLGPDEARRGVDFALSPAGVLEVSLAGSPVGGRREPRRFVRAIRAAAEGEDGFEQTGFLRGRTRTCRLRSLEPGKYRVTLGAEGDGDGANVLSAEVDVAGGQVAKVVFQPR